MNYVLPETGSTPFFNSFYKGNTMSNDEMDGIIELLREGNKYDPFDTGNLISALAIVEDEVVKNMCEALRDMKYEEAGRMLDDITYQYWQDVAEKEVLKQEEVKLSYTTEQLDAAIHRYMSGMILLNEQRDVLTKAGVQAIIARLPRPATGMMTTVRFTPEGQFECIETRPAF